MARYKRNWSADHQRVFELYSVGVLPRDIMKKVGFCERKVRYIIRSKAFQERYNVVVTNAVGTARKALESKLCQAADVIVNIMLRGKPDERLKFDAAKEILYQCGMKPVEVVETRTRQYTPEEIQSSLTVIKEIENIEKKLSSESSKFLVQQDATEPVNLANIILPEETIVVRESLQTADNTGQETLST